MHNKLLILAVFIALAVSCREKPLPKPAGYFRIGFNNKSYHSLTNGFPYLFDIPDYAFSEPDRSANAEPGWINIEVPGHKAEIHLSYKPIRGNLPVLTEESRKLAYEHTLKASSIEEDIFLNPRYKVYGTIYQINGNAASPLQFYMTDSTRHFLRGALYIRATPNIDSLKPVIDFLKTDIMHLIKTLRWTDSGYSQLPGSKN
jgi:gliding motility-associated lipoprotein GldD